MSEILNGILTGLLDIDESLFKRIQNNLNLVLNGDIQISSEVDSWNDDALSALTNKTQAIQNAIDYPIYSVDTYESAVDAARIITEGTDEEVARFGLRHSAKTYLDLISGRLDLNVAKCSEIGRVVDPGNSTISITWKDPDDLELNGSVLAEWERTELWRCSGAVPPAYPGAEGATLVATTDKAGSQHVKDSFYTSAFVDTGVVANGEYTYKLFSYTTLGNCNNLSGNVIPATTTYTFGMLHSLSQAGILSSFIPIGEMFTFNHVIYGELTGVLVDYDGVDPHNRGIYKHAAVVQTLDCVETLAFDSPEDQYALTPDTTAQAGKTYYLKDGSTYTEASLETGDDLTSDNYYEKNVNPNYNYGTNKFCESNAYQLLNSETDSGWFVKKNLWDKCTYMTKKGIYWGLEQSLKDIIIPVDRTEIQANNYGGGTATVTCKLFLPHIREIDGATKTGEGKKQWQWYALGDTTRRIKHYGASACNWWSSSANPSYAYTVYIVTTSGPTSSNGANDACGLSFAFAF